MPAEKFFADRAAEVGLNPDKVPDRRYRPAFVVNEFRKFLRRQNVTPEPARSASS